ncbi:thiamine diphosphokinase [Tissierella creatinophila]|uniref:Thiamine diphosphokinase n=1 Tax=Tissierella creatinophila DSM 6911 TaxID=1123403 RepID=A0A1U7M355_TISCR|nr:thiamine diphosphokinase [Tissierella creatinophila]OLS01716.1 thiamine pyrophosphokinase [Tissierella creatinophila DSM 6911]
MKGLIISSGEIKDYKLLSKVVEENDYIVCADGGVNHLLKIDKLPNIVLGDLDSIGEKELKILKNENVEIRKFPKMKDETDTELCINYLLQEGYKDIRLMGVTGTRFDHTLANIYLLKRIYDLGARGKIIDANNRIFYTSDSISLKKKEGFFISIIPISKEGIIISLEGFLYPLKKDYIEFSSTRGISNKIVEECGDIKIHRGEALVIESKD